MVIMRIGNKFYYGGNKISERSKRPSEKMKESGVVVQDDGSIKIRKFHKTVELPKQKAEYVIKKAREERPSRIKRSCKKKSKEKLFTETLKYIMDSEHDYVKKESISRELKVKEHQVEQVFHKLNLLGILSQRIPNYAHDTSRNPIFWGSENGWAADLYYINDRNKVEEMVNYPPLKKWGLPAS